MKDKCPILQTSLAKEKNQMTCDNRQGKYPLVVCCCFYFGEIIAYFVSTPYLSFLLSVLLFRLNCRYSQHHFFSLNRKLYLQATTNSALLWKLKGKYS